MKKQQFLDGKRHAKELMANPTDWSYLRKKHGSEENDKKDSKRKEV